jgi:hypothetical protein
LIKSSRISNIEEGGASNGAPVGTMILKLEIETRDRDLDVSFPVDLGNDVRVNYENTVYRKTFDLPDLIELTVRLGVDVSAQAVGTLVANWLWQRKDRVEKIRLERTEIEFDNKENMKKIVTETIEKTTGRN